MKITNVRLIWDHANAIRAWTDAESVKSANSQTVAERVGMARIKSRVAADRTIHQIPDLEHYGVTEWRVDLEAALIDAEAGHAIQIHAQCILALVDWP